MNTATATIAGTKKLRRRPWNRGAAIATLTMLLGGSAGAQTSTAETQSN